MISVLRFVIIEIERECSAADRQARGKRGEQYQKYKHGAK